MPRKRKKNDCIEYLENQFKVRPDDDIKQVHIQECTREQLNLPSLASFNCRVRVFLRLI